MRKITNVQWVYAISCSIHYYNYYCIISIWLMYGHDCIHEQVITQQKL